jgi:endonuclease/exonuclease/phosphatase family metal-dependent hydrolase
MDRLHVATLNILNLADRWPERQGLIYADMAALQPDLLALQEVVYVMHQDRLIGAAGEGRYAAVRGWAGRPEYGNCLLVREPLVAASEARLDLGLQRAAHRVRVALPDGATVIVAVTHLHHPPDAHAERDGQAQALLGWLDDATAEGPTADATILAGDFNAGPDEPAYSRITAAGYRSVHLEANGHEPQVTWPSGLIAPAMDTEGEPDCLDYIWIRGAIRATACRLVFDRPAADDPTLYPSDHFGLAAHLEIG